MTRYKWSRISAWRSWRRTWASCGPGWRSVAGRWSSTAARPSPRATATSQSWRSSCPRPRCGSPSSRTSSPTWRRGWVEILWHLFYFHICQCHHRDSKFSWMTFNLIWYPIKQHTAYLFDNFWIHFNKKVNRQMIRIREMTNCHFSRFIDKRGVRPSYKNLSIYVLCPHELDINPTHFLPEQHSRNSW